MNHKEKYLLFAGKSYYPLGGIEDYIGSFDTIEAAKCAKTKFDEDIRWKNQWAHIASLRTLTILCKQENGEWLDNE